MKIPDQQLALFEQRLQAIGLGRRDFLKAVGAMAAFGGLGLRHDRPGVQGDQARGRATSSPRSRSSATAGAGTTRTIPPATTSTRTSTARAFPRSSPGSWCSIRTSSPSPGWPARSRATRTARCGRSPSARTPAGRTTRPSPRATSSTPGSGSWIPPPPRPTPSFLYDIKNGEAYNKKKITDAKAGRRSRQGRLDARGDPGRSARLLPRARRLSGRAAQLSARRREVRRQVDGARQHRVQRPLRARDLGAQQADDASEEPVLLRRQGRSPHEGGHSRSSRWPRAPCPTRTTRST